MPPAKRQKRNAVEAIDHAGAEPVRVLNPFLPRKRGEVKAAGASVCRAFASHAGRGVSSAVAGRVEMAATGLYDKVTKQQGVTAFLGWAVS
jgi:hypothetical protein